MPFLSRYFMATVLCCRGPRSESSTPEPQDGQRLHTLQPASVVPLALPSDRAPHQPDTDVDETQALRRIFEASSPSHQGYQAATQSSASFDADFKSGSGVLARPKTIAHRSLDKLGHNIRLRLSQSRLSNHSSRKSMRDMKSTETVLHTRLLPANHTSTGLDDLLISRNVSQGGYDSDAKGIQTPSWTKASAGSVLISPKYTAKVLHAFDDSPSRRSVSSPCTPGDGAEQGASSASLSPSHLTLAGPRVPPGQGSPIGDGGLEEIQQATATPMKPVTPRHESFIASLQLRPQESPSDVLRRLSVGLANGTIRMPETPELKAIRMPSIIEALPEWRLSFAAPIRASSLHWDDAEARQALQTLSNRVEKARRDSAASDGMAAPKRASSIPDLDPNLLRYLSDYGCEEQRDDHSEAKDSQEGSKRDNDTTKEASRFDSLPPSDIAGVHTSTFTDAKPMEEAPERTMSVTDQYRDTEIEGEGSSIHLCDMRISQRLASTSVLPTTSLGSTNLGPNHHHVDRSFQSSARNDPLPIFTGKTSAEHLRKPSDPGTRRLFEPDEQSNETKSHPKWKSVASTSSSNPEKHVLNPPVERNDESLTYFNDRGVEHSDIKTVTTSERRPSTSRPTSNSYAVAGQQGLLAIPSEQRRNSDGASSVSGDRHEDHLARSFSEAGMKESKLFTGYKKKPSRSNLHSEGGNTVNEQMSMIDFWNKTDVAADPNERMSEIEFADALSKKLGSSIWKSQAERRGRGNSCSEVSKAGLDDGTEARHETLGLESGNVNHDEPASIGLKARDECATDMWERALRTARRDPSFGSFNQSFRSSLGPGREDQPHNQRLSEPQTSHLRALEVPSSLEAERSRSRSLQASDSANCPRKSFDLDQHQSLCATAKKPLMRCISPARSIGTKKSSFVDMRRFITAGGTQPMAVTSGRDLLAWARFPSHSRTERNEPAAEKDGIRTRDFSPATNTELRPSMNRSKLSLMNQREGTEAHSPGSGRLLKLRQGKQKSRSMNFANLNQPTMQQQKDEARKKTSITTATSLSLSRWKKLCRSHSSDLRRFRAGHRSSVSRGGKVDFPELEVLPGYDGNGHAAGKVKMEELGDVAGEARRQKRRTTTSLTSSLSSRKGGLWDSTGKKKRQQQTKKAGRITEVGSEGGAAAQSTKGAKRQNIVGKQSLLFSEETVRRQMLSSEKGEGGDDVVTAHKEEAGLSTANPWVEVYQGCVDGDDDASSSLHVPPTPPPPHVPMRET